MAFYPVRVIDCKGPASVLHCFAPHVGKMDDEPLIELISNFLMDQKKVRELFKEFWKCKS